MTWIVPMWAMIGCTLFGALVLTGTTRYLFRHRLVAAFRDLPNEKRGRLVILEAGSHSRDARGEDESRMRRRVRDRETGRRDGSPE